MTTTPRSKYRRPSVYRPKSVTKPFVPQKIQPELELGDKVAAYNDSSFSNNASPLCNLQSSSKQSLHDFSNHIKLLTERLHQNIGNYGYVPQQQVESDVGYIPNKTLSIRNTIFQRKMQGDHIYSHNNLEMAAKIDNDNPNDMEISFYRQKTTRSRPTLKATRYT